MAMVRVRMGVSDGDAYCDCEGRWDGSDADVRARERVNDVDAYCECEGGWGLE